MGTTEWSIIAVAGFLVGAAIGFLLAKLLQKTDSARLSEVEAELESYRGRVTEHFSQSAAHFQAIGRQYRELYEHMAEGSEKLCAPDQLKTELNFPRPGDIADSTDEPTASEASGEASEKASGEASEDKPVADKPDDDDAKSATGAEQHSETSAARKPTAEAADSTSSDDETKIASADEKDVEPEKRLYH